MSDLALYFSLIEYTQLNAPPLRPVLALAAILWKSSSAFAREVADVPAHDTVGKPPTAFRTPNIAPTRLAYPPTACNWGRMVSPIKTVVVVRELNWDWK